MGLSPSMILEQAGHRNDLHCEQRQEKKLKRTIEQQSFSWFTSVLSMESS